MRMASYYFWKWADNDLAGKPAEVHAMLLRGELHPALQTFDARPVLAALEALATGERAEGEERSWQVHPHDSPDAARFVFTTGPQMERSASAAKDFLDRFLPLDISGFDEMQGHLIQGLPPKLNGFIFGQARLGRAYDIVADELPVLIRSIRPDARNPFGILTNRRGHFVQCLAKGRRFVVEWRENHDWSDFAKFDHWKAQDIKRLSALTAPYTPTGIAAGRDPDLLTYADTLRIFQAFLRGEPRPAQYHWRRINLELT